MMERAAERGFPTFVIVSHSFELLNRQKTRPNAIVLRRFERLCRFLADRQNRFRTVGFHDLAEDDEDLTAYEQGPPLRSNGLRTLSRFAEQAVGRVLYG